MEDTFVTNINYIGRLQELAQKSGTTLPVYDGPTRTGPDHNPKFTMICKYAGLEEEASSATKKGAKLLAAKKLFERVTDVQPTHAPIRLAADDSPHQLRFRSLQGEQSMECDDTTAVTDVDSTQVGARNSDVIIMEKNPISFLQEYMITRRCMPKYEEIESKCGTHINWFKIRVQCGQDSAEGAASSKKEAKTNAAKAMIQLLNIKPSDRLSTTSTTKASNINYIGALQEIAQKKGTTLPIYDDPTRTGSDHDPKFIIRCKYGGIEEEAIASTKKEAKVLVAKKLYERVCPAETLCSDIKVCNSKVELNSFLETVEKGLEELSIHENNHKAMAESVEKALKLFLPLSKTSTDKAVNVKDGHSYNDYHTFLKNAFSDAIRGRVMDKLQDLIRNCQDFVDRNGTRKLMDLLKQALKELNIEVKEVNHSVNNKNTFIFGLKLNTNPVISEIGFGDSENVAVVQTIFQLAVTVCILIN